MSDPSVVPTPRPVLGPYDAEFWRHVHAQRLCLQRCAHCGAFRYPPGPACADCLSPDARWTPVCGAGTILSWAVFHRTYLPAYPSPYNVIAVRLEEGPILVSNLQGETPPGDWIGRAVRLVYAAMPDGFVLPRFVLAR